MRGRRYGRRGRSMIGRRRGSAGRRRTRRRSVRPMRIGYRF